MCGIFGYFSTASRFNIAAEQFESMGEILFHRGPDDVGIYQEPGVGLGNRRLSILDLKDGNQPFFSDDGQIVVVQNGEIFNYIELASELRSCGYRCSTGCDTEVLLRLYERDGISMLSKLNGMFAIAILDKRENALYLARDRIGVKPLYFHINGDRLLFASEIKSLLSAGVERRINLVGLHHFLTYNYVPQPYTMFDGIEHLPPGHFLRIDKQAIEVNKWWNLADQETLDRSEREWADEFNYLLDSSVHLRLRSDVPVGAFLSGGVDSSTIVGVMSRHLDQPVRTYTIGFHETAFDESGFAQAAATRFNTDHTSRKVDSNMLNLWPLATWHCDQPHGDVSFLPTYRVAQLAAKDVKVVLTGDGADELFAGYDKYVSFFTDDNTQVADPKGFQHAYYRNLCLFGDAEKTDLYSDSIRRELKDCDSFSVVSPIFEQAANMDRINQALYLDMQLLLSGNNLVKPDRMGMAVSLEARNPFLDYRMMEFAFRIPGSLKLRGHETKYIYKNSVKDLIGSSLAYRKKQMFTVPVGEWFRGSLSTFTESILLNDQALDRNLFKSDQIKNMLSKHQRSEQNFTREIRALIAIELWCSTFLDNSGMAPLDPNYFEAEPDTFTV